MPAPGRDLRAPRAPRLAVRPCSAVHATALAGALAAGLVGCRTPAAPPAPTDAAAPPVDAAVTRALADEYAVYAGRQATLRCACAADQPYCLAANHATLDAAARACVADAAARDVTGFAGAVTCLDAALDAHDTCAEGLVCADVTARAACLDTYEATGESCLASLPTGQVLALLACFAPDAGP